MRDKESIVNELDLPWRGAILYEQDHMKPDIYQQVQQQLLQLLSQIKKSDVSQIYSYHHSSAGSYKLIDRR